METVHLSLGLSELRVTWTIKVRLGMHGKVKKICIDLMIGSPDNPWFRLTFWQK